MTVKIKVPTRHDLELAVSGGLSVDERIRRLRVYIDQLSEVDAELSRLNRQIERRDATIKQQDAEVNRLKNELVRRPKTSAQLEEFYRKCEARGVAITEVWAKVQAAAELLTKASEDLEAAK